METMIYDAETGDVVTKSERRRRQAERAAAAGVTCKRFPLPDKVERGSWVFDRASGALVPRGEYYAAKSADRHGSGPSVISDSLGDINGLMHPVSGRHIDSKAEFRRVTRAAGCEEIGGGPPPTGERPAMRPVADSLRETMARMGRPL